MGYQVKVTSTIELDIETAAKWFSELDDDAQAKFFVEVAKQAAGWSNYARETQFYNIGSHLKNCECSTEDARAIVRDIFDGMQNGTH